LIIFSLLAYMLEPRVLIACKGHMLRQCIVVLPNIILQCVDITPVSNSSKHLVVVPYTVSDQLTASPPRIQSPLSLPSPQPDSRHRHSSFESPPARPQAWPARTSHLVSRVRMLSLRRYLQLISVSSEMAFQMGGIASHRDRDAYQLQ